MIDFSRVKNYYIRCGLICPAIQPDMGTDAIPSKEHLHGIPGDAHIHFLANVLIGDGVVHLLHGDVVIRPHCGDLPRRQLERAGRNPILSRRSISL